MASFQYDQAEGLRRLLGGPKQRVLTFLSALPHKDKNAMLVNLATSFARSGSNVFMLDACRSINGVSTYLPACKGKTTLLQVASGEKKQHNVCASLQQGFDIATLARGEQEQKKSTMYRKSLEDTLDSMIQQATVVMIDVELDENDSFQLDIMEKSEIVLQVADNADSIKNAYSLIKRLHNRFGRRSFSVLISGSSEERSQVVFQNMAETANQYLGIELYSIGFVPQDEFISRAASLGRSVVDAFPKALASVAFRRIAGSFSDVSYTDRLCEMVSA